MRNIKFISLIALIFLIIGIIGSIFTFRSVYQSDLITKEEVVSSNGIMNIDILTDNTKIEIVPTNNSDISAKLSTRNNKYELITKVSDATFYIEVKDARKRSLINLDLFSLGTTLTVDVPMNVYDSLRAESDNGRITIGDVRVKDLNVEADNGRIELENIESNTITGNTSNGRITLQNINSSIINVHSSNGRIILENVEGELRGRSNNGRIELVTSDLDRPIDLETNNGKINIQTEQEPTNVTYDIRVDNGKIDIFGKSNWDTIIGNGDNLIKLRTDNGGITITK